MCTGVDIDYKYYNQKSKRFFSITLRPITNFNNIVDAVIIILKDETKFNHIEKNMLIKKKEIESIANAVTHDLKTPMISIINFTNRLKQDILECKKEDQLKYLDIIEKNSKHVNTLLSDANDLLRIERIAEFNIISFDKLVKLALKRLNDAIYLNKVKINVLNGFPNVYVDDKLITDMLVQLLDNSIKYTRKIKNPEIEIGHLIDMNGDCVFFIRDNGIGIDKNQHEKIFNLFYKPENNKRGTGIGLAIVKKTVEIHDGKIWVESEKGKGCKICFTLSMSDV